MFNIIQFFKMAKETTIAFIYDTKKLQNEEDDPATAILYFHPTWVSDQQKTVLCGQLIGIIHCLRKVFSIPDIITLESGKFCINSIDGRYLLAVGTDRNIADWILFHRNNLLHSLIKFYHKNIEEMAGIYGTSEALSIKMYHVCETYLKIILVGGNTFSIIPTISLPKSTSNVFIETSNILQYCQYFEHVLGGLILFHNKVVATQLSPRLTKYLVLTDPYRIKSPAEVVSANFHLPIGVQLLQIYISKLEYMDLSESSEKIKTVFRNYKKTLSKESVKETSTELIISDIKRDCSLFFTAVPEEDNDISPNKNEDATIIRLQKPSRPKFLNLKSKISDIKELTPMVTMTPYTPFTANPGSVISTPMTDLNKVLHINTYSICTDPEPEIDTSKCTGKYYSKNTKLLKRSNSFVISTNEKTNSLKPIRRIKTISDPTFLINEIDVIKCGFLDDLALIKHELLASKNIDTVEELPVSQNPVEEVDQTERISRRKSLTLPLKSLSFDSANCQNNSDSSGLLTPLMHKLSSLTFERKSSGISSINPTPLECKDVIPLFKKDYTEKFIDSRKELTEDELVECVLFVCGQQDTVLGIILEPEVSQNEKLINMLWEVCTGKLGGLEKQLQQCMEPYSGNLIPEQEPYSFLCLDSQWDTLKRGGPWETGEASSLSKLHRDFQDHKNITEILSRENDSILYGVHIGDSEIFYRQSESANSGLPTPSDSMGHVPMRAKRSLERDHSIVLL